MMNDKCVQNMYEGLFSRLLNMTKFLLSEPPVVSKPHSSLKKKKEKRQLSESLNPNLTPRSELYAASNATRSVLPCEVFPSPCLPLVAAAEAAWWFSWPAPAEQWPPRSAVWPWSAPAWPGSSPLPLGLESLVPLDITNRGGVGWARQEVKRKKRNGWANQTRGGNGFSCSFERWQLWFTLTLSCAKLWSFHFVQHAIMWSFMHWINNVISCHVM